MVHPLYEEGEVLSKANDLSSGRAWVSQSGALSRSLISVDRAELHRLTDSETAGQPKWRKMKKVHEIISATIFQAHNIFYLYR